MKRAFGIGLISIACLMFSGMGLADDKHSISGTILFTGDAVIYISLHTNESFREFKNKLSPKPFLQVIKPNAEQLKQGKANFQFSAVPAGTYCIVAFHDLDGDGKMKSGTWGAIEEPYAFFKESTRSMASWDDVKFVLKSDLSEILLRLYN